jgi:DNA modification methylase
VISNPKWFRYEWIWEKTRSTGFLAANRKPLKSHENILVFSEKSALYHPQKSKAPPYKTKGMENRCALYGKHRRLSVVNNGDRYPNTIIKIPNPNFGSNHPTQKPVALFEYLIKTYTNEGDLILDNCAGSGTTAIAALNTGRDYILMEKEAEYIEVIHKRIASHTVQLQLAV